MRRYQTWTEFRTLGALIAGVVAGAAIWFGWPGPGIYAALALLTFSWPPVDRYEPDTPGSKASEWATAMSRELTHPWGAKVGFGDPGENSEREPTRWPPTRLSSYWAIPFTVAAGVAAWFAGAKAVPLDAVAAVLIWQAATATARRIAHPSDAGPAAMAKWRTDEPEEAAFVTLGRAVYITAAVAGAGVAAAVVGLVIWAQGKWPTAPIPSLPAGIGIAAAVGVVTGAAVVTRRYITQALTAYRYRLEQAAWWQQTWMQLGVKAMPALYAGEYNAPPDADQPTHRVVHFQCLPGASVSTYEDYEAKLAVPLNADLPHIGAIPQAGADGQPQAGTRRENAFTVTYNLAPLPVRPLLDPDLDGWTTKYVIRAAFARAFAAHKLGRPELANLALLTVPGSPQRMIETTWQLPPGVTYEDLAKKAGAIQQDLAVPWLRVGRRHDPNGVPADHLSIVYGPPPDTLDFGPGPIGKSRREFVRTLEWEQAFRQVGLIAPGGTTPRFESDFESDQGLLVSRFYPAPNIPFVAVEATGPKLIPTIGRPYVLIEADASQDHKAADGSTKHMPALPAGGFQIITGDSDPLDRMFNWNDYIHQVMVPPGDQPQMEFYVGVGADGGLVNYSFVAESPHAIIAGASGRGKLLRCTERVYKADLAPTTVGELQVGDRLFDDRGLPCTVTKVFAVEVPPRAYRLVFDDGTEIIAGGEHRWVSHTAAYRAWLSKRAALEATEVWQAGSEAREAAAVRLRALAAGEQQRRTWPPAERDEGDVFDEEGEVWAGAGLPDAGGLLLDPGELRSAAAEGLDPYLVGAWLSTLGGESVQVASSGGLVAERLAGRGHRLTEGSTRGRRRRWGAAGQRALFDAAGVSGGPSVVSVPELLVSDPVRAGLLVQGAVDAVGDACGDGRVSVRLPARAAELVAKALGAVGVEAEVTLGGPGPRPRDLLEFAWQEVGVGERPPVGGFALGLWLAARGTTHDSRSAAVGARSAEDVARLWREGQAVSVHPAERWSRRVVLLDAKDRLPGLGVDASSPRRVPGVYLEGPEGLRRDVLDGLLVGAADEGDGWSAIPVDSPGFADDVAGLAGSLGLDAEVVESGAGVLAVRVDEPPAALPGPPLFDSEGWALVTVAELAGEAGVSQTPLRRLVADGTVGTVAATRPVLQRYEDRFVVKPGPVLMVRRAEALSAVAEALVEEDGRTGGGWPQPRLVDTDEIYATLRTTGERAAVNHAFPVVDPVEPEGWEPVNWQVRPYELGAWLGDGFTKAGAVCGIDHHIFDRIIDEGRPAKNPDWRTTPVKGAAPRHPDYRVVPLDRLSRDLRAVGVLGRKHIPEMYLRAPVADRLALMQGLMDTDGHVGKDGRCEFVSVVPDLADGFGRLLSGLGIKYARSLRDDADDNHQPVHRFQFTTGLAVVSLPRKAARLPSGLRGTQGYRYVVDCVPVPPVPMRCLSVDSPSSQFLVGEEMVPTHNSNEIHSMLLQLLNKNRPDQLELWMAEPKNELQRYQCVPHLTRFIDMRSVGPDESIYDSLGEMLRDLAAEMERRYAMMDELPGRPQKLADMLVNPHLREPVPYIVCLVEECADYFAPPSLKDHRPAWEQVVFYGELLARKARASGIFMVFATQRPTKQSIPANIKGQSRRIGFGTTTMQDSMVVIDQPGLEHLTAPGRGMVTSDKQGYRQFRAMYMPPEVTEDIALSLPDVECLDPRARDFSRGAAQGLAGAAPPIPQGIWGDGTEPGPVVRPGEPFETPYGPSVGAPTPTAAVAAEPGGAGEEAPMSAAPAPDSDDWWADDDTWADDDEVDDEVGVGGGGEAPMTAAPAPRNEPPVSWAAPTGPVADIRPPTAQPPSLPGTSGPVTDAQGGDPGDGAEVNQRRRRPAWAVSDAPDEDAPWA